MPELPDVTVYVEALNERIAGRMLEGIRLASPFVLRSAVPPLGQASGKVVVGVSRLGKRIVIELAAGASGSPQLFLVIHLMIAGRFQWKPHASKIPGKLGLAAFDFESGTLILTEASSKKRASLHLVEGGEGLRQFDRGGLEVLGSTTVDQFREVLLRENHTLKRSLTDPRLFSGIGNAYSDEILHRAQMSPAKLTRAMTPVEMDALFSATRETLEHWTRLLREEAAGDFPEKVTAFRPEMAVHGKYRQPCPRCGTPVQRIAYADNETNYCPRCQTGGKLLADRSLSRLLKDDWPKTIEALEASRGPK